MSRKVLAAVVAICAVALPSSAAAKLPRFANHRIVVGKSVGGLTLQDSLQRVDTLWGHGSCGGASDTMNCDWNDTVAGKGEFVSLELYDPTPGDDVGDMRVDQIWLNAGGVSPRSSRLRMLKTDRGIGIGSTLKAARKAYPKAHYDAHHLSVSITKGATSTSFFFDNKSRRVVEVFVSGPQLGVAPPPPVPCSPGSSPFGICPG